jgi:hypothetical protein
VSAQLTESLFPLNEPIIEKHWAGEKISRKAWKMNLKEHKTQDNIAPNTISKDLSRESRHCRELRPFDVDRIPCLLKKKILTNCTAINNSWNLEHSRHLQFQTIITSKLQFVCYICIRSPHRATRNSSEIWPCAMPTPKVSRFQNRQMLTVIKFICSK